ncbi:MAG: hypothetical protein JST48_10915 [Bacteroidetes bacterium]|nr:hypothetical protein [Bacteroidota bacterium]
MLPIKTKSMKQRIVVEIISFLFILLFLYAAFSKLFDFRKFSAQIGQSPLLTGFGSTLPAFVIGCEIVVSFMFMVPRLRLTAFFLAFCLMVMFTSYIIAILNFSNYVPCSCGGVLEKLGWREHVIFNAVFVLLSLAGIIFQSKIQKTETIAFYSKGL